jgi:hypothetical protein
MKNFTLLLIALLIAFTAFPQSKSALQRLQNQNQNQEVFSNWAKKSFSNSNIDLILATVNSLNQNMVLKNAAAKTKLDSIVSVNYNTGSQVWSNDWKDEFNYDSSSRFKESVEKEWDAVTSTWIIIGKTVLTYNAAGQITKMNIYSIDENDGKLKNDGRLDYFFSSTGRLDSAYTYNSENETTWELTTKNYYSYNSSGKVTQSVIWSFDEDEEEWLPMMKTKYAYNNSGRRTEDNLYFSFDDEELLFLQTLYTWNSSGKLISEKSSGLNFSTFSLEKTDSIVYSYNAAGDQSKAIEYIWNQQNSMWVPEYQDEYIYGNLNFSDIVYPYLTYFFIYNINPDYYNFNKAMVEVHESKYMNNAFVLTDKSKYFYSGTTSIENENLIQEEVSFYPNPASDKVIFTWSNNIGSMDMSLYQISGSKIMEKQILSQEPVIVGHLERGVYVYKLMNGQNLIQTGKIVLK